MSSTLPSSDKLLAGVNLTKRYGTLAVLNDCTCHFFAGDKVLLLGANGTGKSTLLRILAGLLRPDRGTRETPLETSAIGYSGHDLLLYPELSVKENLSLFNALIPRPADLEEVLVWWELTEIQDRTVGRLSRGQQARVTLARATLH